MTVCLKMEAKLEALLGQAQSLYETTYDRQAKKCLSRAVQGIEGALVRVRQANRRGLGSFSG